MPTPSWKLTPLAAALAFALPGATMAACPDTLVVTTKSDVVNDSDGKRSLREAINKVQMNSEACTTIRFDLAAGARIVLQTGLVIENRNVRIEGPGADKLSITHTPLLSEGPVVSVSHSSDVTSTTISGITFDGDSDADGTPNTRVNAMLYLSGNGFGSITLDEVVVRNVDIDGSESAVTAYDVNNLRITNSKFINNARSSGNGGALNIFAGSANNAPLVRDSLFRGNSAAGNGGGLFYTAESGPALQVRGSTFDGNSAGNMGGGIGASYSTVTVQNSTFSRNTAAFSGGAMIGDFATINVNYSTIVYNRSGSADGALATQEGTYTGTHSIVSLNTVESSPSNSTGFAVFTNSLVGKSAEKLDLTALRDNGGPTPTHLPKAGSIAIDAGREKLGTAPATDQRGEPRLRGGAIDIGAVETAP